MKHLCPDQSVQYRAKFCHHDGGFENDRPVATIGFQYPEDEPTAADPLLPGAELLTAILEFVWTEERTGPRPPGAAFRRFAAASALLRPELLDNKSYAELGAEIGCTKANLSLLAGQFQRRVGLKFRRSNAGKNLTPQ